MPVITFDTATLTTEQKRTLAREMSRTAAQVTGLPQEAFYVFFREHAAENVAVGETLLVDRKAKKAEKAE